MSSEMPEPSAEAIGRVIRGLRNQTRREDGMRMQQKDLAKFAEYGEQSGSVTISNIENGRTRPKGKHRALIAEALGTTWPEIERTARVMDQAVADSGAVSAGSMAAIRQVIVGKQKIRNEERASRLERDLASLQERHERHVTELAQEIERSKEDFTVPFFTLLTRVDDLPTVIAQGASGTQGAPSLDDRVSFNQAMVRSSIVDMVGTTAAMGALGTGLGAAAAATTYAAVGAFAMASTGTAIAGLSGAAASSATLAWLGGGSLAAGGAGMAGGAALLTGILAVPAAVAILTAVVWKGRKIRKESEEEARTITAAEAQLAETVTRFEGAWAWADEIGDVITDATMEGMHRLGTLAAAVSNAQERTTKSVKPSSPEKARVPSGELDEQARATLVECLDIAAIILALQALPIWARVAASNADHTQLEHVQEGNPGSAVARTGEVTVDERTIQEWASWNTESIRMATVQVEALAKQRKKSLGVFPS